jgi:hypothetical protein
MFITKGVGMMPYQEIIPSDLVHETIPFPEDKMLQEIADYFKDVFPEDKWKSRIRKDENWEYCYSNRTKTKTKQVDVFEAYIIKPKESGYGLNFNLVLVFNPRYGWSYYISLFDVEYGKRNESKGLKNMFRVFEELKSSHQKIQLKMDELKEVGAFK